jgi:hypothetical protein
MQWRSWRTGLAVLATLGALTVAGRLLDLTATPPPAQPSGPRPTSSTVPARPTANSTTPPRTFPKALARPLRLPSPPPDGSCPATPPARGRHIWASDPQTVALGDGPVYPVLFTTPGGLPDRTSSVHWVAPKPLGGVAIVRGHRLGMPHDPVRFQAEDHTVSAVEVLDPAAGQTDNGGSWWLTFLLRAGVACYGLQIDGAGFSEVVVVDFRACCRPHRSVPSRHTDTHLQRPLHAPEQLLNLVM